MKINNSTSKKFLNKRTVVYLIVAIILPFNMQAQTFGGGPLLGLTGSQIDGDTYSGFTKLGFEVGTFVTHKFSDKIIGQLEIKYIQKGAQKPTSSEDMSVYNVLLQYAEFPLLVRYNVYKNFDVEMGLAPGILLASSQNIDGDTHIDIPFNKLDLPWVLGVCYFVNSKLGINIKHSYSIVQIRNHPADQVHFLNRGQFNRQLCIGIYYIIK
jgi:hypothetical protein